MSNPYLTNPLTIIPIPGAVDPNPAVVFYYGRQSDGTAQAAVYDAATQLPLWEQSFSGTVAQSSAPAGFNPFSIVTQLMQGADGTANQAPGDGMLVIHPFPFCPISIGCWLPVPDASGNLEAGIAIICAFTNQIICYRKCVIDPTTHSFTIAQDLPVIGTCSITLQLLETSGQPSGFKGEFKLSGGVFPSVDIPVQVGSGS